MATRTTAPAGDFEYVGESGIDERKRVSLTKALAILKTKLGDVGDETIHFKVYVNDAGQVLLEPAVSVPIREMWLYRNPAALEKVRKGLKQAASGKLHDLASFAKHADDAIE
jgi:hypothetical protein